MVHLSGMGARVVQKRLRMPFNRCSPRRDHRVPPNFAWQLLFLLCSSPSLVAQDAWERLEPHFRVPQEYQGRMGGYRSPLRFADGRIANSESDWMMRRAEIRSYWMKALGEWPKLDENPDVQVIAAEDREGIRQLRIRFDWVPGQATEGYLLLPAAKEPVAAVVTVFYEPETAIGRGKPYRDFGIQLARRGFAVLSLGTTQATEEKTYAIYYPSIEDTRVQPLSMLAYAAATGLLRFGQSSRGRRQPHWHCWSQLWWKMGNVCGLPP